MDINLFAELGNVNVQVQKKRRKNDYGGMWGAPINIFNSIAQGGFNQGNTGWGQQQNNNGWGQQQSNDGWGQQQHYTGGTANQGGWGGSGGNIGLEQSLFGNMAEWGNNLSGFDWVREQSKRQSYDLIKSNAKQGKTSNWNGLDNFFENQITFLQPSPSAQKLEQLKKQGKQFLDDRFPPNAASLSGEYSTPQWNKITWQKIEKIVQNPVIFSDKVQPGDIKQGYLGDCYFLAALAALAERPDRIFNLFLLRELNSVKYYSMKMLFKGKWLTIDVDQNIPSLYNKPAFSDAVGGELWVVLLEKGWAKMYTSFKRIQAGYPQQGLHDLTGAPIKQIRMKQGGFDKQAEWQYLVAASLKQYAMVASSNPGSDTNKSVSGIVQGHAYTFLNATVLNFNGGSDRIVQMRNPWGQGQSKGKWSDDDSNWQRVPESEKQRIKYQPNGKDGIFFMSYDDFIHEFRSLTVCEINDNASYVYKSAKDKNSEGAFFAIEVPQNGYYSFHVDNLPQRTFQDKIQNSYNYPQTTLELARVNGNSCQKLGSQTSNARTLYKGYQLTPGMYVAFVKIRFDSKFQKQFDVNLAVYAEYACKIDYAPRELAIAFTGNQSVRWNPADQPKNQRWNHLGNLQYEGGSSQGWSGNWGQGGQGGQGWGDPNQGGQGGWGGNQGGQGGWQTNNQGGQGGWASNDGGWGQSNNGGNQGTGWGGGGDNGWGNQGGSQGGDNGWGNQGGSGGNGWSNSGGSSDNGWGSQGVQQPQQQGGWGKSNNNGWGETNSNNQSGWGGSNNQGGGNSSGWGSGW